VKLGWELKAAYCCWQLVKLDVTVPALACANPDKS